MSMGEWFGRVLKRGDQQDKTNDDDDDEEQQAEALGRQALGQKNSDNDMTGYEDTEDWRSDDSDYEGHKDDQESDDDNDDYDDDDDDIDGGEMMPIPEGLFFD